MRLKRLLDFFKEALREPSQKEIKATKLLPKRREDPFERFLFVNCFNHISTIYEAEFDLNIMKKRFSKEEIRRRLKQYQELGVIRLNEDSGEFTLDI